MRRLSHAVLTYRHALNRGPRSAAVARTAGMSTLGGWPQIRILLCHAVALGRTRGEPQRPASAWRCDGFGSGLTEERPSGCRAADAGPVQSFASVRRIATHRPNGVACGRLRERVLFPVRYADNGRCLTGIGIIATRVLEGLAGPGVRAGRTPSRNALPAPRPSA
jgi:hypothetical protein